MYKMHSDLLMLNIFRVETDLHNDTIKCVDGNISINLRRTLKRAT